MSIIALKNRQPRKQLVSILRWRNAIQFTSAVQTIRVHES